MLLRRKNVYNWNANGHYFRGLTMDYIKKPVFLYSRELEEYSYPPESLFSTQRAGKTRELLMSLGLLGDGCGTETVPVPATKVDLERFHSVKYLDALQQAADGKLTQQGRNMGFGTPDCPVFKDMFNYARWACGATLTGANLILSGETDIVFNPSGGFHHAGAEKASGFCYINDLALACMRFSDSGKKVVYLDIDAHHGDGVQEAFYATDAVLVISLHESGKTLWPWGGFEDEIGAGAGKGFNVNVPLPLGICDDAYLKVFNETVIPLITAYVPDIIALQLGMDALAGDALAHLELTNNAHAEIIDRLLRFNTPILATGGGGYHVDNTVRGWALAWKVMCGQEDEDDFTLGMGGVMLQSTEWSGGLRDRILPADEPHCESVESEIRQTMDYLTGNVFKYHGI
ncbi:MAG: acetoin utilization protein AcuC [Deltaproteobacteria bacterium]|nr:MAG: acetoin utilization protein AcuC [Deltaproteobacteria bacterium]RLC16270.1 MAG: acetoin utilization protein AcuC [Deltaproteobacteria bacterium]